MQQEKDDNFISRLHGGKLDIMPWPVIESREFYKLFGTLKARLDQQAFSHSTAGEFLHTIKTLMAKLKVCLSFLLTGVFVTPFLGKQLGDAFPYVVQPLDIHIQLTRLSETMAEHRARSLSSLLPIALATGYSEIEPDVEPLKVNYRPKSCNTHLRCRHRTLTQTLSWNAMTLQLVLLSLIAGKFHRPKLRGIL